MTITSTGFHPRSDQIGGSVSLFAAGSITFGDLSAEVTGLG